MEQLEPGVRCTRPTYPPMAISSDRMVCPVCDMEFESHRNVIFHLLWSHPEQDDRAPVSSSSSSLPSSMPTTGRSAPTSSSFYEETKKLMNQQQELQSQQYQLQKKQLHIEQQRQMHQHKQIQQMQQQQQQKILQQKKAQELHQQNQMKHIQEQKRAQQMYQMEQQKRKKEQQQMIQHRRMQIRREMQQKQRQQQRTTAPPSAPATTQPKDKVDKSEPGEPIGDVDRWTLQRAALGLRFHPSSSAAGAESIAATSSPTAGPIGQAPRRAVKRKRALVSRQRNEPLTETEKKMMRMKAQRIAEVGAHRAAVEVATAAAFAATAEAAAARGLASLSGGGVFSSDSDSDDDDVPINTMSLADIQAAFKKTRSSRKSMSTKLPKGWGRTVLNKLELDFKSVGIDRLGSGLSLLLHIFMQQKDRVVRPICEICIEYHWPASKLFTQLVNVNMPKAVRFRNDMGLYHSYRVLLPALIWALEYGVPALGVKPDKVLLRDSPMSNIIADVL